MKKPVQFIDFDHLETQTGRDPTLQREVLALFVDQATEIIARLGDSVGSPEHRADLAHRLKGSAQAVGAFSVADAADAVETDFRIGRANSRFFEELRKTVDQALPLIRQQIRAIPARDDSRHIAAPQHKRD